MDTFTYRTRNGRDTTVEDRGEIDGRTVLGVMIGDVEIGTVYYADLAWHVEHTGTIEPESERFGTELDAIDSLAAAAGETAQ